MDARTQLLMIASALGANVEDLWEVYTKLFREMDVENNPKEGEFMLDMLTEFEYNLTDLLDHIRGQIYLCSGLYEPMPTDTVEDFEASVLRTIAGLDELQEEQKDDRAIRRRKVFGNKGAN